MAGRVSDTSLSNFCPHSNVVEWGFQLRDYYLLSKQDVPLTRVKVTVRFQAVGSAPILRQKVFKVGADQKFETVANFLRKKLDCKPTDSVFLYVNSIFAPGLDEGVGNLFRVSVSNFALRTSKSNH